MNGQAGIINAGVRGSTENYCERVGKLLVVQCQLITVNEEKE